MIFTHDTELALAGAAALVNTLDGDQEKLPDVAALDAFIRTWQWTGTREHSDGELRAVRALRPRLRQFWVLGEDGIVDLVNALLREARALPQLVKHDHWDYHLHATPPDAPLATRMAVDAAMALVDVVRAKELGRLRVCDYPTCDWVMVDLSKNRSKRFCDNTCGNRAAVEAYRARQAGKEAAPGDATGVHELPWIDAAKPTPAHRAAGKPRGAPGGRRGRRERRERREHR